MPGDSSAIHNPARAILGQREPGNKEREADLPAGAALRPQCPGGGHPAWGGGVGLATESPPSSEALRPLSESTEAGRKPWERSNSVEKPVSSLLSR